MAVEGRKRICDVLILYITRLSQYHMAGTARADKSVYGCICQQL